MNFMQTQEMIDLQKEYKALFGHRKGFDLEKDMRRPVELFKENMRKEIAEKKKELEKQNQSN